MKSDGLAAFTPRAQRTGLFVLGLLAMLTQGFVLNGALRSGHTVGVVLSGLALLAGVVALVLAATRRIELMRMAPVVLGFAVAWQIAQLIQAAATPGAVSMPLYVAHLVLVSVAYTLLPVVPATGVGVLSGASLFVVALTRSHVEWEILMSTLFLAGQIGYMSVHGHPMREQRVKTELALDLSGTDVLTGLLSRRTGQERLQLMTRIGPQDRSRKAVIVLDVEQFGAADTSDRAAGDDALRRLAAMLPAHLNEPDFACRWGANELLVVLNDTTQQAAFDLVDWWRRRISLREKASHRLSLRAGTAMFTEGKSVDQVLALAEARLYSARIADREALALRPGTASSGVSRPGPAVQPGVSRRSKLS